MSEEYLLVKKRGGGINDLIVAILMMPFAITMSIYDSYRASHISSRIEHGRFDVVMVSEFERDDEEKILAKCKGLWDETKPTIKGSSGDQWFKVDQSRYQRSPKPAWIRRTDGHYDRPIYGVFVGRNPIQQLRDWLKENGYYKDFAYGGDGQLVDIHASYRPNNIFSHDASGDVSTPPFREFWRNKGEKCYLEVEGLIETSWGLWRWDSEQVTDVSSRSYDEQNYCREVSGELRDALLPFHENLYRRTGLAFFVSLIWRFVHLVMSVIANVTPFIAAVIVWTTKSGPRPPIPMLIFRYFGLMFSIFFVPFSIVMMDLSTAKWAALIWVAFSTGFGLIIHTILMSAFAQDELAVLRQNGRRSYWDEWDWPIHTATERTVDWS